MCEQRFPHFFQRFRSVLKFAVFSDRHTSLHAAARTRCNDALHMLTDQSAPPPHHPAAPLRPPSAPPARPDACGESPSPEPPESEQGCPWDASALTRAAAGGPLARVMYALRRGVLARATQPLGAVTRR